jgi:ankyrin repeat protein
MADMMLVCTDNDVTAFLKKNLMRTNMNEKFAVQNKRWRKKRSWYPINYAIETHNIELLEYILKLGLDPKTQNYAHFTNELLPHATIDGNPKTIELLLWYGADINSFDQFGKSALYYAVCSEFKDCVAILINYGAKLSDSRFIKEELETMPVWVTEIINAREQRRQTATILLGLKRFNRHTFYNNNMDVARLISRFAWFDYLMVKK